MNIQFVHSLTFLPFLKLYIYFVDWNRNSCQASFKAKSSKDGEERIRPTRRTKRSVYKSEFFTQIQSDFVWRINETCWWLGLVLEAASFWKIIVWGRYLGTYILQDVFHIFLPLTFLLVQSDSSKTYYWKYCDVFGVCGLVRRMHCSYQPHCTSCIS